MSELCDWREGLSLQATQAVERGLVPPEAIRICNPCGIAFTDRMIWRGQCGKSASGKVMFMEARYGIRAASIIATTLYWHLPLPSLDMVVRLFCDPTDLTSSHVVDTVCRYMNMPMHTHVNLDEHGTYLARCIIKALNTVKWEAQPFNAWYSGEYVREAVASSHIL